MDVSLALRALASPQKARVAQSFFKTGPGQYSEGDQFLGVTVPQSRIIAQTYRDLDRAALKKLLLSPVHEERMVALLILAEQYKKQPQATMDVVLEHRARINIWDLVDLAAPQIIGRHLVGKNTALLTELARSNSLWDRRIAIVSTLAFIRAGQYKETIRISQLLLKDEQDLIHKAVGWMLREMGKKDPTVLEKFLQKHAEEMPRTALRYAIERFPEAKRKQYLSRKSSRIQENIVP